MSISTGEPPRDGAEPVRAAQAVLHDVARRTTIEARVDLESRDRHRLAGAARRRPQLTEAEFLVIEAAVRRSRASRRRSSGAASTTSRSSTSTRVRWAGTGPAGRAGRPPPRADPRLRPAQPGGNAYAHPLEGDLRPRRSQHRRGRPLRGPRTGGAARPRTASSARSPHRPARRPAPDPHRPARGTELHRRRPRGALAEVARCASASPAARAWSCTTSATRTTASCARSSAARRIAEMVVPYARPRPLLPDAARHRRVQPRHDDQLADARLRLPRRHPLLRRRVRPTPTAAPLVIPQRDLHARGGRRRSSGSTPTSAPATSRSAAPDGS